MYRFLSLEELYVATPGLGGAVCSDSWASKKKRREERREKRRERREKRRKKKRGQEKKDKPASRKTCGKTRKANLGQLFPNPGQPKVSRFHKICFFESAHPPHHTTHAKANLLEIKVN